ncbi:MAG: MFS transporter [Anaerolineae bacterium]
MKLSLQNRFPALVSRDFAIFWVGHLLSLIGTTMQNTAQPLLAYRLSGRPFDLGLIGFAISLPTFFLALPGGVLIEHVEKRKALIGLQAVMMAQSFVLAFLTLSGKIQIWHMVALSLVLGIASAFEITARQAMLIELVGREALPNAIALQSAAFNLSRVLGPSLTVPVLLLFPEQGEGLIFLLNGISFIAIIVSLLFVQTRYASPAAPRSRSLWDEFSEGAQFLFQHTSVGMIILVAALLGLFAFPLLQQIPVVAKDLLAQPFDTKAAVDARNSALYTAQGIGALIASFLIAMSNAPRKHGQRLLLGEAAFIGGMIGLAFSRSLSITLVLIGLMGWGAVTQLATMNTLVQLQVPNGLRGRVFSIYLWGLQGIAPFGSLLIGWMTQTLGLPLTALICGLLCLVSIGGIQVFYPAIRQSVS